MQRCEKCHDDDDETTRARYLCDACARRPDCERLGLAPGDDLSGFTSRLVRALAHLREAWCGADPRNAAAIEAAIRALFEGSHSVQDSRAMMERVLVHGLDRPGRLLEKIRSAGDNGRSA
jgi:hypothetical protein